MTSQAGIFTLGCFYKNHQEVEFMSMYGSVTDAQVFSRELSSQEMVDITSCRSGELHCTVPAELMIVFRSFPQGDIISWDREPWSLRSPWNRSEAEMLDLEKDVCATRD